jgi:hypothetical protein
MVSTFGSTTITAGSSTIFTIGLDTSSVGSKSGNLTFNSNDSDEPTVSIALSGEVTQPSPPVNECEASSVALKVSEVDGWSYYAPSGTTNYIFAIEHAPTGTGANTSVFEAEITNAKKCTGNNVYEKNDASSAEGTFVKGSYWNIELTSGSLNGWVNLRWFNTAAFETNLEQRAAEFSAAEGVVNTSSKIHFTTKTPLTLPTDIRADGKGLIKEFSTFLNPTSSTFSGSSYYQYNQVSTIDNSGGSILVKASNATAVETVEAGTIRFNTTINKIQGFNGTEWVDFH